MYEALKTMLADAEGRIEHLYLDTKAHPTIGVGHMVPNQHAAQEFPLVLRNSSAVPPLRATQDEIAREYQRVLTQKAGMKANYYSQFCALKLTDEAIDNLLDRDIEEVMTGLTTGLTALAGFALYPEPAQCALLDMAFNLGVHGLRQKFPRLCAAAERKDWPVCAIECHREGISEARNAATEGLFRSASG